MTAFKCDCGNVHDNTVQMACTPVASLGDRVHVTWLANPLPLAKMADADIPAQMEQKINAVYDERNRCVAGMTAMAIRLGWRTWLGRHEPLNDPTWDKEWLNVVFIELPTGQVSWHIHDRDLPMFNHVIGQIFLDPIPTWDKHTTEEKYQRIAALRDPLVKYRGPHSE